MDGYDVEGVAPFMVVLCGPSHSGKSTFAARYCKGFNVISSDRIRKRMKKMFCRGKKEPEVWKAFYRQKRRAVRDGFDIVLDACHLTHKARTYSVEGVNGRYKRICVVFDLPWPVLQQSCLRTKRCH